MATNGIDSLYSNPAYYQMLLNQQQQLGGGALSDDFYASQYFNNAAKTPAFNGVYNGPAADTFQSSKGSGLTTGLTLGGLAAAGTGAGVYFWGSNPVNAEGKVADGLVDVINSKVVENNKKCTIKELFFKEAKTTLAGQGINNIDAYDAVQQLAKAESLGKLPKDVADALPVSIRTPDAAKNALDAMKDDLARIDVMKLEKRAEKVANRNFSIPHLNKKLTDLNNIQAKIKTLADTASEAEIEKFIKDNASTFGIKGTPEQIAAKAKMYASTVKNKASLAEIYKVRADKLTENIKNLKDACSEIVTKNWDSTSKALKDDTPQVLKKAVSKFKWNKTIKYGGITGAAALVLGWMFG